MHLIKKHIELIIIIIAYLIGCSYLAMVRPIWFDELFTHYIVETGSISKILELLGPMDPHPPVHYLMVFISHSLLGVSELSTRLPAIVMLGLMMVGSYAIIEKFCNKSTALFCVLLILVSVSFRYSYEARPYSSVLAFTTLTYWFWFNARENTKWLYITLSGLFCGITVLTHFYAVLGLIPIFVFQFVALIKEGKPAFKLSMSIAIGTSLLLLALPTLKSITVLSKDNWAAPSLYDFIAASAHFFWFTLVVLVVSVWDIKRIYKELRSLVKLNNYLLVTFSLAGLILYGFLFSLISGAFHYRYVFSAFLGSVLTTSILFYILNPIQKRISLILIVIIGIGLYTYDTIKNPFEERARIQKHTQTFQKIKTPIVFGHYLDYLQYYHYSDSTQRKQLVYLIDYSKNFDYPSISGDVSLYKLLELKNDLNIQDYNTFIQNQPLFHFYGNQSFSYDMKKLLNESKCKDHQIDDLSFKRIQTKSSVE